MDYCIALTTASSEAEAQSIASALIADRLAACINFYPIQSMYTWKEQVHCDQEWQLVIKTQSVKFAALSEKVKTLHSYDVPELLMLRIEQGSAEYLGWLSAQVGGGQI